MSTNSTFMQPPPLPSPPVSPPASTTDGTKKRRQQCSNRFSSPQEHASGARQTRQRSRGGIVRHPLLRDLRSEAAAARRLPLYHFAGGANSTSTSPALNLDASGKPLTYKTAMRGPNKDAWEAADITELCKLLDKCMRPIHPHEQPLDRRKDTTYFNKRVKEKITADGDTQRRIRGTAGGNLIFYPGDVAAQVAEMEVVKAHIQSVISDRQHGECYYMTADISDFYLGAPLDRPE